MAFYQEIIMYSDQRRLIQWYIFQVKNGFNSVIFINPGFVIPSGDEHHISHFGTDLEDNFKGVISFISELFGKREKLISVNNFAKPPFLSAKRQQQLLSELNMNVNVTLREKETNRFLTVHI